MNAQRPETAIPWPDLDGSGEADIAIVGLGPGAVGDIPLGVWHLLHRREQVILRTERHPAVAALAPTVAFQTCDDLYAGLEDFPAVYAAITRRILDAARAGPVVYAVPGHPWMGEATTGMILEEARRAGYSVAVLGGASFAEPTFGVVGRDAMAGGQVVDAMLLARQYHPRLDVGQPVLVGQLYARAVAADVKLTLLNAYPAEHPVTLVRGAGTPTVQKETFPLHELDHRERFDHLTSLYIPPLIRGSFVDLQELIAHLRAPEGCPWDQEQTLESLSKYLLDETCEVLEAVDNEDDAHTAEELGDLLGIVAMVAQVATEEGRFQMADAVRASVEKLIRRHPHVFGETDVADMDDLYRQWDAIKHQERIAKGQPPKGPLDGVPASLPALEKARELQSKAQKAGLLDRETLAAENPLLARLLPPGSSEADLGRLLWQLVAHAHGADLNPEAALRRHAVGFRRAAGG